MKNLELFYEWSALVLAWLYEKFPMPTSLHHGDLKSSSDPARAERIMRQTVMFLQEEGFLRFAEFKPPGQFAQVRLSLKGLNRLSRIPEQNDGKATLGERLVQKVHAGGKGSFRDEIAFFLAEPQRS